MKENGGMWVEFWTATGKIKQFKMATIEIFPGDDY
jgi:hypothetical protein